MSEHYVTLDEHNSNQSVSLGGPSIQNINQDGFRHDLLVTRSVEISTQTERRGSDAEDDNQGSMVGAVFILMNAVLGAGILEFPYTFSQVGLLTALQMMLFVVIFAVVAHVILARAVDRFGGKNYQELIGLACGTKVQVLAQVCLVLYCFGSCLTYMVTIGDQLCSVCQFIVKSKEKEEQYCQRYYLTPAFSIAIIFPIIWIRNISSFGYVSFFSVASVFYLVAAVVSQYFLGDGPTSDDIWYPKENNPITILSILPVLSFGYQCHMTSVPLYAELYNRTLPRYSIVIAVAMVLVSASYLLLGVLGLLMFGHATKPDIIMNYPPDSVMITVGRFAVAFSVSMTYPIVLFIGRAALEDTVLMWQDLCRIPLRLRLGSEVRRISMIFTWFTVNLLIACFADSIKDVISVAGSIAALFMFFFPGILFLLNARRNRNPWYQLIGCILIALGAFVFIWNIADTFYEKIEGSPSSVVSLWGWSEYSTSRLT